MKLSTVTIERFRNFVDAQTMDVESDVTCLVGKNELGKTALLRALHRLKPANGSAEENTFDLTIDYPRWRLARDRKKDTDIEQSVVPVQATYLLDDEDREALGRLLPIKPPDGTVCRAWRRYDNGFGAALEHDFESVVRQATADAAVAAEDLDVLLAATSVSASQAAARKRAPEVEPTDARRARALKSFATEIVKYAYLCEDEELDPDQRAAVWARVPSTFYFSSYDVLPGECDLTTLAAKPAGAATLTPPERTVMALLTHAGENSSDFLDVNYASRKAELQAASSDLTQHVFKYWRQNPDLEVVFDDDNVPITVPSTGVAELHRILKIEIRDGRHGGVQTNFATRSTGFQWFFSFFAAFSEYQDLTNPLVVLLDEPGTSLHGDAQQDFVEYVFNELGASKTTIYTTHSQHMLDPSKYEKLRAIHDRATRETQDLGVEVKRVDLSADRATILPLESALGLSVSQHLFLGSGPHLTVEGSSDFVFILRLSEHALTSGTISLDPHFAIIPVGGSGNMPAFVALMGRRLKVTALVDGIGTSPTATRCRNAAKANGMSEDVVVVCGDIVPGLPSNADIEDLFDVADYLRLYNWAFGTTIAPCALAATTEPILRRLQPVVGEFDHALPAHALTDRRDEFFASVSPVTVERFTALFERLNATLTL